MDVAHNNGTMTVRQLSEYLRIGQNTAYKLVKQPGFPAVKLSQRRIVIPVDLLNEWLKKNTVGGDKVD